MDRRRPAPLRRAPAHVDPLGQRLRVGQHRRFGRRGPQRPSLDPLHRRRRTPERLALRRRSGPGEDPHLVVRVRRQPRQDHRPCIPARVGHGHPGRPRAHGQRYPQPRLHTPAVDAPRAVVGQRVPRHAHTVMRQLRLPRPLRRHRHRREGLDLHNLRPRRPAHRRCVALKADLRRHPQLVGVPRLEGFERVVLEVARHRLAAGAAAHRRRPAPGRPERTRPAAGLDGVLVDRVGVPARVARRRPRHVRPVVEHLIGSEARGRIRISARARVESELVRHRAVEGLPARPHPRRANTRT